MEVRNKREGESWPRRVINSPDQATKEVVVMMLRWTLQTLRIYRFRLLVFTAVLVVAIGSAGLLWRQHKSALVSSPSAQQEDVISSEERILAADPATGGRDDTRALADLNLAGSYASAGQCSQAVSALAQARQSASADLQTAVAGTSKFVNQHCK